MSGLVEFIDHLRTAPVFPAMSRLGLIALEHGGRGAPVLMRNRVGGEVLSPLDQVNTLRKERFLSNHNLMTSCLDLIPAETVVSAPVAAPVTAEAGVSALSSAAAKFRENLEEIKKALLGIKPALPYIKQLIQTLDQLLRNYDELSTSISQKEFDLACLLLATDAGAGSASVLVGGASRKLNFFQELENNFERFVVEYGSRLARQVGTLLAERDPLKLARRERAGFLNESVLSMLAKIKSMPNENREGQQARAKAYFLMINFLLEKYSKIDQDYPKAGISGHTEGILKFRFQFMSYLSELDHPSHLNFEQKLRAIKVTPGSPVQNLLNQCQSVSGLSLVREAVRSVDSMPDIDPADIPSFSGDIPYFFEPVSFKLLWVAEKIRELAYYQNWLEMIAACEWLGYKSFLQEARPGDVRETPVSDLKIKVNAYYQKCRDKQTRSREEIRQEEKDLDTTVDYFYQELPRLLVASPRFLEMSYHHMLLAKNFALQLALADYYKTYYSPEMRLFSKLLGLDFGLAIEMRKTADGREVFVGTGAGRGRDEVTQPLAKLDIPEPKPGCNYDWTLTKRWAENPNSQCLSLLLERLRVLQASLKWDVLAGGLAQEEFARLIGNFDAALNILILDQQSLVDIRGADFGQCVAISELYHFLKAEITRIDVLSPSLKLVDNFKKICEAVGRSFEKPLNLDHEMLLPAQFLDRCIHRALQYKALCFPSTSVSDEWTAFQKIIEGAVTALIWIKGIWIDHTVEDGSATAGHHGKIPALLSLHYLARVCDRSGAFLGLRPFTGDEGVSVYHISWHLTWDDIFANLCMLFGRDKFGQKALGASTEDAVQEGLWTFFFGPKSPLPLIDVLPSSIRAEFLRRLELSSNLSIRIVSPEFCATTPIKADVGTRRAVDASKQAASHGGAAKGDSTSAGTVASSPPPVLQPGASGSMPFAGSNGVGPHGDVPRNKKRTHIPSGMRHGH